MRFYSMIAGALVALLLISGVLVEKPARLRHATTIGASIHS